MEFMLGVITGVGVSVFFALGVSIALNNEGFDACRDISGAESCEMRWVPVE